MNLPGQEECIQRLRKELQTKKKTCLKRGSRDKLLGDGNLLKQYVGTCELNKCIKRHSTKKTQKNPKNPKEKKNKKQKTKKNKKTKKNFALLIKR